MKTAMPSGISRKTGSLLGPNAPRERLKALDVLRGLTVAVMIMVNTSGDSRHTFPILAHSRWNGCTLADVVFPCFLFMVGISSVFSVSGRLGRGVPKRAILAQAARRSVVLFLLGLAINSFDGLSLHTLRVYGVLQRIAFCYLAGTAMLLWWRSRTIAAVLLSTLLGYWALLRFAPVPGLGLPGSTVAFLDPVANLPAWLDRHLVPTAHLYRHTFYDPEGLLSSVSAVASTLMGVLSGKWIRAKRTSSQALPGLLAAGLTCAAAGLIWEPWFPWNKRLWTGSFVLWTGGLSLIALCLLLWLVDVRQFGKRWTYPAIVFGTNALAAYVFSEFLAGLLHVIHLPGGITIQHWLYHPLAASIPNPSIAALTYAILFVAVCFLPAWLLYRRRIFLKI
ncbi:putative acyltransferase [Silvibacterium bohemicum]|uniref:Putative acyltransferase n=1 Tax=Silvibacterium bohemicum TaxID=1577686 RepID=A0A841K4A7_9BACT|nr:heparan-alpha-glucosaminide N-acetyltransferase domain-containing protein [Silvibacterium bohemicum]MBB6145094.1 putative acyltransferase [Silvibacterium bohemicum]